MREHLLVVLLALVVGWASSQAPGDTDERCITGALGDLHPVYPDNLEPLMDSRDYSNLIASSTVFPPVWQVLDIDGFDDGLNTVNWTQEGFRSCRQTPFVCGFEAATGGNPDQNNWMITQHISRNVGGVLLREAKLQIEFEFRSCITDPDNPCASTFSVWTYETSVIDPGAANNTGNYELIHRIAPNDISGELRENATRDIEFRSNSETGFYLGIQDINSCMLIHRVLVFYNVCPATTQDLIVHPETIAPPTGSPAEQVDTQCVENARPQFGSNPRLTCSPGGLWTVSIQCECNAGFLAGENGTACIGCMPGTYLRGSECVECPANSNTTVTSPFCPCNDGFFRTPQEDNSTGCTQPPSAPTNLQVTNITRSAVILTWSPPEDDGGRNDTLYKITYTIVGSSEVVTYPDLLNVTTLQLTGLSPFTEYVISVIAENGVSSQVSNNDGRTNSTTVRTAEDLPSEISSGSISQDSNTLQWGPPAPPNGVILFYNLRISEEREGVIVVVTVIEHRENETRLDVNSLGLSSGEYFVEIQAVTSVGPGNYSTPVPFTVVEAVDSTDDSSSVVYIVIGVLLGVLIVVAIPAIIITIYCIWYHHTAVASKNLYHYQDQIELPTAGHRMYVDPTTYTSTTDAVQEFAKEIQPKNIRLEEEIGAGEFGTVYRGIWKDSGKSTAIAVKTLKPSSSTKLREDFLIEASIMGQFNHSNVVKLYGVVTKVEPLMIIMEFMDNGSLYYYLRRNDEKLGNYRLVKMARGVASGMQYLSTVGYVHRDLAARNVLVSKEEVCKVADFGLSRETVEDEYNVRKGGKIPVRWTAPEAISYRKFTSSSDVWSFGVLLWEVMSYAQQPYEEWDNQTVLDKLEAGYRLQKPKDCPNSVYRLMMECWNGDHTKRPPFEQVVTMMDMLLESNMSDGQKPKPRPRKTTQQKTPLEYSSVEEWLKSIKMERYVPIFDKNGITTVNQCVHLTHEDLEEMGITLSGHLHKMMGSIENGNTQLAREPSYRI